MSQESTKYLRELHRKINKHFDEDELKTLVFYLGLDWENISGDNKIAKIRGLIKLQARKGKLDELIKLLNEELEDIDWPEIPSSERQIKDEAEGLTQKEREEVLDSLIKDINSLVSSILKIKSLIEENLKYLDESQTANVIKTLASANLISHVNLKMVQLSLVNLEQVNLTRIDISKANLSEAILNKANLRYTNLSKANLKETDLIEADLSKAVLKGTNLTEADLTRATLTKANLSEAILTKADLREADLSDANLSDADLRGADLRKANLTSTNLTGANLTGARLSEADYSDQTQWPHNFSLVGHRLNNIDHSIPF